ncbi:MAG: AAA family ATPase [Bacillota bacterium]|nr:AAA family ATPase [Bacillota bacterium]
MNKLISLIHSTDTVNWNERCNEAFAELFGLPNGRYPQASEHTVSLRAPEFKDNKGVTFAALIDKSNPDSGAYGEMSFVIFPHEEKPAIIAMVVGTQGLSPDEEILGRPGHGRRVSAICNWLNKKYSRGRMVAWSKQDPARIDLDMPKSIREQFSYYEQVFKRYGKVIYGMYIPDDNHKATIDALKAFLDLLFTERNQYPLTAAVTDAKSIEAEYFKQIFPDCSINEAGSMLDQYRYLVLQGPPGTGKTRMALELFEQKYLGNGQQIQFHPNTTYENFVGGLAPVQTEAEVGLKFAPKAGFLMEAAIVAKAEPNRPYLLVIDEINRADLAKVLGEAIFLLEAQSEQPRQITLPYDFGKPYGNKLSLPNNLHILGTMNSSDRSIAIVDIAVRRRFAFQKMWPQQSVVEKYGCELMQLAFQNLLAIFVEHADDETLALMPGHSYFLEKDSQKALTSLCVNLKPLLEEYLEQGYVTAFADSIQAYLQWLESTEG